MEKRIKTVEIINHIKYNKPYTWGEFKRILNDGCVELEDTDLIDIDYDSESSSYYLIIYRERLETDEELAKRVAGAQKFKDMRYNDYLKLKEEFE